MLRYIEIGLCYDICKGRYINLFKHWISYSTIAYSNNISILIANNGCTNDVCGSEYVNGSLLRNLHWESSTGNQFAEFWSSSLLDDTFNRPSGNPNVRTLIIGNNGYITRKPANLVPEIPRVPRGQRPALIR